MAVNGVWVVARLLWVLPVFLLFLALNQAIVAYELRETYLSGTPAVAEVLDYQTTDRVDVTYDAISLRVTLPNGAILEKENMSLPRSLAPRVAEAEQVDVLVRPGASQEVVLTDLMPAHWLIAAVQVGMALLGAILLAIAVYYWNRYLKRKGDPADASPEDSPAAVSMR